MFKKLIFIFCILINFPVNAMEININSINKDGEIISDNDKSTISDICYYDLDKDKLKEFENRSYEAKVIETDRYNRKKIRSKGLQTDLILNDIAFACPENEEQSFLFNIPSNVPIINIDKAEYYKNQIVIGKVNNIYRKKKHTFVNFGKDWKTDFSVMVDNKCKNIDFDNLERKEVEVRGFVDKYYGKFIKLTFCQLFNVNNQ